MSTTAKEVLVSVFNNITNTVEYSTKWENGTGYLDGVVRDTTIVFDDNGYAKSTTTKGRRMVIVKTVKGNIVIFERYTDPHSTVVVSNMPGSIGTLFQLDGSLSAEKVRHILGDPVYPSICPNLGVAIDEFNAVRVEEELV